jgi:hypothetical protein
MLKKSLYHDELVNLLNNVLLNGVDSGVLEHYLASRSTLPSPSMNLALVRGFAYGVGEIVAQSNPPVVALAKLLDGWAALSVESTPTNDPREILVSAAALSYGQVAVKRSEWWDDEIAKLHQLAADKRWRVRDHVAQALQLMLEADWSRTHVTLMDWVVCEDAPLVLRAAAAAVAEPTLLTDESRKDDALGVQAQAIMQFVEFPAERRKDDDTRALRQALGYTLSVVTAAYPVEGFQLLERLAALPDEDVAWIVRENIHKKRLGKWQDRLDTLETALFRPE